MHDYGISTNKPMLLSHIHIDINVQSNA